MTRFSVHPGISWWALAIVAVVAAAGIWFFYRRAYAALPPRQWLLLLVLRFAALGIVLLLLFRPVITHQRQLSEKLGVTILLDRSASMSIADDPAGGTRFEQATDRTAAWRRALEDDFDVRLVAFADTTSALEPQQNPRELVADGEATSLARAIGNAAWFPAAGEMAAVFVVSDGVHNAAGNPIEAAVGLGVPVHTIGVGSALRDEASYRDLRVTDLDAPDQMAADNLARIRGYLDANGFPNRVITASLLEDGSIVDEQELVLDDIDGAQEVTFEFTPQTKGLHKYTVRAPVLTGEKIPENNERSTSSLVIESRIRVLYLEGTLRAEYGALVGRFLTKDPNIEFCALVQTRPNVFMQRTNIEDLQLDSIPDSPERLQSFDVFILGDLDASYLQAGQMEWIAERVRQGAGLIMTGGYHSLGPGGYEGTPIEQLLPVLVGGRDVGQVGEPFAPQLTLAGRQHPIFANIAPFFPSEQEPAEVDGLPELEGCVRVAAVKPSANVLAVHPVEKVAGEVALPVLAVQPIGEGRSAVFTADTTRNWHQTLRSLERETPFLRFWGQVVRWLAGRGDEVDTEAGIVATTDKPYYAPDAPVTVTAVVRGSDGEAAAAARVSAMVLGPDNQSFEVPLGPVAGPAGNYRAVFQPPAAGPYRINVQASLGDDDAATLPADTFTAEALPAETLQIDVGRPNLEFDRLDLDEAMLTAIATASGGRYLHLSTADRLVDQLQRRQRERLVQYQVRLDWPPLLWTAFVGLLTTEWILRRRLTLR